MKNKKMKKMGVICLALVTILALNLLGCQPMPAEDPDTDIPDDLAIVPEDVVFASYNEIPVNIKPQLADYKVDPDLGNVINRNKFEFSNAAKKLLAKNGFVVIPSDYREFFNLYEMNRYDSIPNFVTTDAMMHNYHLYFSHLLRTLEKDKLYDELISLTDSMLTSSQKQYEALKETDWENAAKRNVAYFAVAASLIDSKTEIPDYVETEVKTELELIADHSKTFVPSPVMNLGNPEAGLLESLKEDYTQYIPRGHYTKFEELKSYFRTMMWYGRMTFRASAEDETKSVALITLMLSLKADYESWNRIYDPTNFFVGKSDDLGFYQYHKLLKDIYDGIPDLETLTGDGDMWGDFYTEVKKMEPPAINSIPIFDETIQPDRDNEIKGFRFMGQRYTLDADVFQRLVYRDVKENNNGDRRMIPNGLDIPAAMGSNEAYDILKDMGETGYKGYPENMKKMQNYISGLDISDWGQNLYWSWLYTLSPLTEVKGKGYPSFMQNQAWIQKQLETYMGSYAELKHDTILYAKQIYAEMGGGWEEEDDRGYVEPSPHVYARLAALAEMTAEGLKQRDLLAEESFTSLMTMKELALKLKEISEKELADIPLDDIEYGLIQSFGGQLEHFWLEALRDIGVDTPSAVYENPAALIADIATDPNGRVLEIGTGFISTIYAVVPVDGKLRIAKGAAYSYYEFPWAASDRLTDEKWKIMLENNGEPEQPVWTKGFRATE